MKHTIGLMLSGLAATILFCACTASPESVAVKISQDESEEFSILAETTVTMTQQITQTTTTTIERKPDLVEEVPAEHVLDVDVIYQRPELPTGCEVTSLTALLQYLGFDVDKTTMAEDFLPCSYDTAKNTLDDAYIGLPQASDGFGCYAPVLVKAADAYLKTQDSEKQGLDLTGSSEETICRYIASGYPVVMWITIGLYDVYEEEGWTTEDGRTVMWCDLEHCVLLHGYDKENDLVYVCDPLNGDVTYSMERYFQIYEDMHKRAMTIY